MLTFTPDIIALKIQMKYKAAYAVGKKKSKSKIFKNLSCII